MGTEPLQQVKIFYCYAHEDNVWREQVARQLSPLRRMRDITGWFDQDIQAGGEWERESKEQLNAANIILLLISADFIASDYRYSVEMMQALERHKAGTAHVIPILLRPVDWEETPFGALSPLPTNRVPVTQWSDPEAALLNIAQGIKETVRTLLPKHYLSLEDAGILYSNQGPLSGQRVGDYLLGELLGEGGYGQVYKAQHLLLQRPQAVKVLLERHFQKSAFRERFLREARTVAALDHPNIIHLDHIGLESTRAYLVMPFIPGGTLHTVLQKQQSLLPLERIVAYLEHICAALDYAHTRGVVHLDLKPLNLLVRDDGGLLLADFGLAHLMQQGAVEGGESLGIGTPHYMAPEHILGHPETRSDIFSLGIILYQMLVGRQPFDGLTPQAVTYQIMTEWPARPQSLRPELPSGVEDVLRKGLAKQPKDRYGKAGELLAAFKQALIPPVQIPVMPYPSLWQPAPKQYTPPQNVVYSPIYDVSQLATPETPSVYTPSPHPSPPSIDTGTPGPFDSSSAPFASPQLEELYEHMGSYVAWNPTGTILASANGTRIKLWNTQTGERLRSLENIQIVGLAWSRDGQVLMIISGLEITLWSLRTLQEIRRLELPAHNMIERFTVHPNGQILASTSADYHQVPVVLWNLQKSKISSLPGFRRTLPESKGMSSLAWNPDGTILAGGDEQRIHLWDTQKTKRLRTLVDLNGHTQRIHSLTWSPDGQILASGSDDHTIKLWNVQTGQLLRTLTNQSHIYVTTVVWNPVRPLLASQGANGMIMFWDTQTGRLLSTLNSQNETFGVSASQRLAWSPDGQLLAQAGHDIKIWRVR